MCDAICTTHNKPCGCSCATPHMKGNVCFKSDPFGEGSLHYHSSCEFDDDGISLTEKNLPLVNEEYCCFCSIKTHNMKAHMKEKHGWFNG